MRLKKGNVERVSGSQRTIEKLKAQGFKEVAETVPEAAQDATEAAQAATEAATEAAQGEALEEMTVKELKALAEEKGLEGYSSLTKAQLLAVLKDVV